MIISTENNESFNSSLSVFKEHIFSPVGCSGSRVLCKIVLSSINTNSSSSHHCHHLYLLLVCKGYCFDPYLKGTVSKVSSLCISIFTVCKILVYKLYQFKDVYFYS